MLTSPGEVLTGGEPSMEPLMSSLPPTDAPPPGAVRNFDALSALLWQERDLLEQLLFTLVSQRAIIPLRDPRWFRLAQEQVQLAVDAVSIHEVLRAAETEQLTVALGLPVQTPLRALAAVAPEPWASLLVEHRDALRRLTSEVDDVVRDNRRLLVTAETNVQTRGTSGTGTGKAWWE